MLRSLSLLLVLAAAAAAAILPDRIPPFIKGPAAEPKLEEPAVWQEYGLEQAETAEYKQAAKSFRLTAWRLKDPTGALAAFQWLQPAGAKISDLTKIAVETSDGGALLTWHNYLFRFEGYKPVPDDLEVVFAVVPKLDLSALPTLPQYLPQDRLVANSERYILGPASLQEFQPGLPLSVVAFSMGAEGQVADVRTKAGQADLALFAYPTPQIAIQRVAEFQKLPGVVAKRTGPMVVALIGARDPDEAELILAGINFKGAVTLNERMPTARDNVGEMLISIFVLTGIIMALIVVAGIAVGLMRRWWSWSGREEEPMIRLHLSDR